jgi:hypothetical protein
MADRMSTRLRMDQIRDDHAVSRTVNGHLKRKERANRDRRMMALIQGGAFPFTPAIQSWISIRLGRPFSQVTEDQAKELAKGE